MKTKKNLLIALSIMSISSFALGNSRLHAAVDRATENAMANQEAMIKTNYKLIADEAKLDRAINQTPETECTGEISITKSDNMVPALGDAQIECSYS